MITNFFIEESYKRFCGIFNELYSKRKKLDEDVSKILNDCENKFIYNKRNLYVVENDDNFMNTIELKGKNISCYKYITKEYYNTYKNIYDKLFELKIYNIQGYKQFETERLELYIFDNFKGKNILDDLDIKIKFMKEQIHEKINIDKLKFIKRNEQKGVFIDYCIKYIINNNYNYGFEYLMSCNKSIDYDNLPENLEDCKNIDDLINLLFEKEFINKILKFKEKFTSIKTSECYVNFDLLIYGEPDLITDNYIIDIKTSENKKIDSKKNYLQTLFYAILANKKNICLYDPINGDLYKYEITNNIIEIKNYISKNKIIKEGLVHLNKNNIKKNINKNYV
jgi:hypothetical protein